MSPLHPLSKYYYASLVAALLDQPQAVALVQNLDRGLTERLLSKAVRTQTSRPNLFYAACRDFIGSFDLQQRQLSPILTALRQNRGGLEIQGGGSAAQKDRNNDIWMTVAAVGEEILASYLKGEYPQTAAVILSMLEPSLAAKIIHNFPDDLTADVLYRLLHLEFVKSDLLTSIAVSLRSEIYTPLQGKAKHLTSKIVANILNNLDSAESTRYLDALRVRSVEATDQVEAHMFTFEDLLSLAPETLQVIVASVDKDLLCVSLKGAPVQGRKAITSQMSSRGAKAFEGQFTDLGRVKSKEINMARNRILTSVKNLAAQGLIELDKPAAEVGSA